MNAYDHDVSACLLRDGEAIVAIEKERLTRIKHDVGFYGSAVDYCLFAAGIDLDDVDLVVRCSYLLPTTELERRLRHDVRPTIFPIHERSTALSSPLFAAKGPPRCLDVSHHLAHAYSAFACSPFEEGVVYVADGVGSYRADVMEAVPPSNDAAPLARESESLYRFEGNALTCLEKVWSPPTRSLVNEDFFALPGMGGVYSRVSSYIFRDWNACGEVMGLAPYAPADAPELRECLFRVNEGVLSIAPWPRAWQHPYEGGSDAQWAASEHLAHWQGVAACVQRDTEAAVLQRVRDLHARTGATNLTLAGGVHLNCVSNGRVVREGPFEHVWIQPAAGDSGIALGAALYGWCEVLGQARRWTMRHAFLGMPYPAASFARALDARRLQVAAQHRRATDVHRETAELLAEGAVVGWFQGGAELGPRALGHRSILADPRRAATKDLVNARVKFRQGFRPFAPVVLAEHAPAWFDGCTRSPFMLQAHPVRPDKRALIPSVVHVDGSARVQTVDAESNPKLAALLRAFYERTGVPVLLNTSFNLRGQPIVESPQHAVDTFLSCDMDVLVLGEELLRKRKLGTWMGRLRRRLQN